MQTIENRPRPTGTIVGAISALRTPNRGGGAIRGLDSSAARADSGGSCPA